MRMALVILTVLLVWTRSVCAEVPAKAYDLVKDTEWFKDYINGVGVGLGWANVHLMARKQERLYCVPENLALEASNYLDIIERKMSNKEFVKMLRLETPLELILLNGLEETFPCKK